VKRWGNVNGQVRDVAGWKEVGNPKQGRGKNKFGNTRGGETCVRENLREEKLKRNSQKG